MMKNLLPTLAWAAAFFIILASAVQFMPGIAKLSQNRDDTNQMRAEDFIALETPPDIVLIGSSQAFRLQPSFLGPRVSNLSLGSEGPLTGLKIIAQTSIKPKLVLIETNFVDRPEDADFIRALFRFPDLQLRKAFKVFRAGYDPVQLVVELFMMLPHKKGEEVVAPPSVIDALVAETKKAYASPPDPELLSRGITSLKQYIASLKAQGIQVGFFEMPIDARLANLPHPAVVREEMMKNFSPKDFCWIDIHLPTAHTLDGIHLTLDDAADAARLLMANAKKCVPSEVHKTHWPN